MKLTLRRFPLVIAKPIPGCKDTRQVFIFPGLLVGRGYFTVFWFRTMVTVTFNTTLEYDTERQE
jgi:hypothetical protein